MAQLVSLYDAWVLPSDMVKEGNPPFGFLKAPVIQLILTEREECVTLVVSSYEKELAVLEKLSKKDHIREIMEASRSPIAKSVAQKIIKVVCADATVAWTEQYKKTNCCYQQCLLFRDDPSFQLISESKRSEFLKSCQEIYPSFQSESIVCGTITTMISLWRQLAPNENRSLVCSEARQVVGSTAIADPLMELLTAASNGRPTYIKVSS